MLHLLFDYRFTAIGRALALLLYPIYAALALLAVPVSLVNVIVGWAAARAGWDDYDSVHFGPPPGPLFRDVLNELRWLLWDRPYHLADAALFAYAKEPHGAASEHHQV